MQIGCNSFHFAYLIVCFVYLLASHLFRYLYILTHLMIWIQNDPVDILECLSVMINDGTGKDTNQVQELILDDQLLGTMVTTITLPDGTQAFVTNNFSDIG